jgi:tetratricopeptide (TPR) repeat protein
MLLKFEEGNSKLKEGEFEIAKQTFSELLDQDPNHQDYITGYFISSYWDNRIEIILNQKEGKDRGSLLVKLFNEFLTEFQLRNFSKNETYESLTFCILSEASAQFRTSYQKDGLNGLNKEILSNLVMCLTGIGDYRNAIEIIEYSKKYYTLSIQNLYYLAECSFHVGEESKSRLYYRMAIVSDIEPLNLEIIKSEPLLSTVSELNKLLEETEKIKYFLPVKLLEKNLLPEVPEYTREEISDLLEEISRLEKNLNTEREDLRFKVECRILTISLSLLDSFSIQVNQELLKKIKNTIFRIDPELLDRRSR